VNASTIIFYILSAVILGGGLMAVTSGKIFRSAIYLLFSLSGIAGLYFYLDYEFIAAVQVVVYVGGIVVLIIFSIFLTHDVSGTLPKASLISKISAGASTLIALVLACMLILRNQFIHTTETAVDAGVANIGRQMLSTTQHGYILPFELVSILLLAAMIGCIVIALKTRTKS
jgi:NADH-quinone oxidoreductase subunit J